MTEQAQIQSIARQMVGDVDAFRSGTIEIDDLSFTLKARLALIEQAGADHAWVEELRSFRNEIEVVNAVLIGAGRTRPDEGEQRQLREVLDELREALVEH